MKIVLAILIFVFSAFCSFSQDVDVPIDMEPEFAPPPVRLEFSNYVICSGDNVTIGVIVESSIATNPTYLWENTGETTARITISSTKDTIYIVKIYDDANANVATLKCNIFVTQKPVATTFNDTICEDREAVIGAITSAQHFHWTDCSGDCDNYHSNGSTKTINVNPQQTTAYYVHVSNYPLNNVSGYSNNCYTEDSAMVIIGDTILDYTIVYDSAICNNLETDMSVVSPSFTSVEWFTGDTAHTISYTVHRGNNNLVVHIANSSRCRIDTVDFVIVGTPTPGAIMCDEELVCEGEETFLTATGGMKYKWENGKTTDTIHITVYNTTYVSVTIYGDSANLNACDTTLGMYVTVGECTKIYFASAFNPKGINNIFKPIGHPDPNCLYELIIYNKFGQQVFQSNIFSDGWDGTFNGKIVEKGTYVYRFRRTKRLKTQEYRGTVTIVG